MQISLTVATVFLPMLALGFMLWNRSVIHAATVAARGAPNAVPLRLHETRNSWVHIGVIMPVVLMSVLAVWTLGRVPGTESNAQRYWSFERVQGALEAWNLTDVTWETLLVYCFVVGTGAGIVGLIGVALNRLIAGDYRFAVTTLSCVILGTGLGLFCFLILNHVVWPLTDQPALQATICPPLFMVAFVLAGFLDQWLVGKWLTHYEREWRSRLAADVLMAALAWAGFFGVTLYLPLGFESLSRGASNYVTGAVMVGWITAIIGGVFAARSPRAIPGFANSSRALALLARVAPVAFLVGLLALLSLLLSGTLRDVAAESAEVACIGNWVALGGSADPWHQLASAAFPSGSPVGPLYFVANRGELGGGVWTGLEAGHWRVLFFAGLACLALSFILAGFADVNIFSLHALYGNRLVRCFLAASRRKEHENPQNGSPRRRAVRGQRCVPAGECVHGL